MTDALLAGLLSFALLAAVFVPLERSFPARPGQRILRPAWHVDATFFFGQYLLWNAVAIAVLTQITDATSFGVLADLRREAEKLPLALTLCLAVVGGDLCVYAFHRACHRFDILWRFHAVHHSAEHLDWLAAHREHPVDGLLTQLAQNLPAIAIGIPASVLAPLAVFRGMWAVFLHSNTRLPLGPLRWVLGAPELHHWHHARLERTRHNFANLAPWIDLLFGTHHLPEGEEAYLLGVPDAMPRGYLAQLAWPVRRRRPSGAPSPPRRPEPVLPAGDPGGPTPGPPGPSSSVRSPSGGAAAAAPSRATT